MSPMAELSKEQRLRYSRNIMLDGVGSAGQQRLLHSRVAIIGSGALGSIVAMYLAGSGVGHITIVDYDTIDISNLQRQLSFSTHSCGEKKVHALHRRLTEINPDIEVTAIDYMLTTKNIAEALSGQDLVIEGTDNPATKYLVTDTCLTLGIPYILGGVSQYTGQVMSWRPGYPTYRDTFPEAAIDGSYTPCALGGILGPLPGIIASTQAAEAIKILTGVGTPLYGRLYLYDALTATATTLSL